MKLTDCHNIDDFRALAKRRMPWPVFDYIDGAADDEVTRRRNRAAFDGCDLIPRVLAGVESVDMRTTLFGREMAMPLFLSPTALQRLFHWQGERAVLRAAANAGTMAGISSLATISLAEAGALTDGPKLFQLYVHKDEGLNRSLVENARAADFDVLALTVDTIIGGNGRAFDRVDRTQRDVAAFSDQGFDVLHASALCPLPAPSGVAAVHRSDGSDVLAVAAARP